MITLYIVSNWPRANHLAGCQMLWQFSVAGNNVQTIIKCQCLEFGWRIVAWNGL